MDILTSNVSWMVWNSILAMLPVGLAWMYFKTDRKFYKGILAVLWFLYVPNSLYVISDMEHLLTQWPLVSLGERLLLLVQYIHLEVIGLTAFLVSMYAFERALRQIFKNHHRKIVSCSVIVMQFLIGFAMIMGKVERVNSWEVFTATDRVIEATLTVLRSDQLVWLGILFGLFGNFFYFLLRDPFIKYLRIAMKTERLTNKAGSL